MDDFLNTWPADAVQTVNLRFVAGNTRPVITSLSVPATDSLTIGWTIEPGESYNLQHASTLDGTWTNAATVVTGPSLGPLTVPPGFLRIAETHAP